MQMLVIKKNSKNVLVISRFLVYLSHLYTNYLHIKKKFRINSEKPLNYSEKTLKIYENIFLCVLLQFIIMTFEFLTCSIYIILLNFLLYNIFKTLLIKKRSRLKRGHKIKLNRLHTV